MPKASTEGGVGENGGSHDGREDGKWVAADGFGIARIQGLLTRPDIHVGPTGSSDDGLA